MRYAAYVALLAAATSAIALLAWARLSPSRRVAVLAALAIAALGRSGARLRPAAVYGKFAALPHH